MATEWKNLPDTSTPITAGNLIKDQTAVQVTQPTGGQNVWIKDSKNLFDYTKVQPNKTISSSDGTISTNTSYAFCGYIPVKPNTTYTRSAIGTGGNTFLGANFNYISSAQGTTFTTPANCYYVGFNTTMTNYNNDTYKTFMVNEGSTLLTYEPYIKNPTINELKGGVYKEIYNKDNMGDLVVDSVTGKNLFDKNTAPILGIYINANSNQILSSDTIKSTYIKCNPNTTYTISKQAGRAFRWGTTATTPAVGVSVIATGANHTGTSITITTGATANYLVVTFYDSSVDTATLQELINSIQIELGSEATNYVPYKNFDATAYVLWENSSPSGSFAGQQITLNDDVTKYKYYEIIFKQSTGSARFFSTGKIPSGERTTLTLPQKYIYRRYVNYDDATHYTFGDCFYHGTYGSDTTTNDNTNVIPYRFIAYK